MQNIHFLIVRIILAALLAPCAIARADEPSANANPLSAHNKFVYSVVKPMLLRSAEKMSEEQYAFKPVDTVRSFGEIIGHVADSQYYFCSVALGAKNPAPKIEKTKKTKAELIAALNEAFVYCDKAYDTLTDAQAAELTAMMGAKTPKLFVLTTNVTHMIEHYGNLVTYMRMNNIVPPTSEPGFLGQFKK